MPKYTKARQTMQYTEVIYYRDGEEIAREELNDHSAYDIEPEQDMTDEEIEDWT